VKVVNGWFSRLFVHRLTGSVRFGMVEGVADQTPTDAELQAREAARKSARADFRRATAELRSWQPPVLQNRVKA